MNKVILWDVDGTLLEFKASERDSLIKTYDYFSLGECTDELINTYSSINQSCWEMLERGEITKEQTLILRFDKFFEKVGITDIDSAEFSKQYENGLADTVVFIDNSKELLLSLKDDYKQYAVTNGAYNVQTKKLEKSGFNKIFYKIFISDDVGYEKPSVEFFNYVRKNIVEVHNDEILIVGDSLTSDIKGGNNMGIKTCLYDPDDFYENYDREKYRVDYRISNLSDIQSLI